MKIMKSYPKVMMFVCEQNKSYFRGMEKVHSVWDKKSTQDSWFKTTVEFEPSFKYWFALMWQNGYILIFLLALIFLIGMLFDLTGSMKWWSALPAVIMLVIGYKGFYQYYQDMKNDTSR